MKGRDTEGPGLSGVEGLWAYWTLEPRYSEAKASDSGVAGSRGRNRGNI